MIIFILLILFYTVYLNIKIREFEQFMSDEIDNIYVEAEENKMDLYNKMMEWRKELKNEKPRRRSTKSSRKVSTTKVPKD
tara:strand:+ start:981 stop:1220 length:240 start_codon:yes stop_codon:yes gene_type:complete